MRHIEFKNKTPMDSDIPGWEPWSEVKWTKWLQISAELHNEAAKLDA